MGIQEEIFEEFFKNLEGNEEFPNSILEELKRLWESGEITSQEKLSEVVERECGSSNENQDD